MSKDLSWDSPIESLFKTKKSKTLDHLKAIKVNRIYDLLWIFPLRVNLMPKLSDFNSLSVGELFRGKGNVISFQSRPNFGTNGKFKTTLENSTLIVQDSKSDKLLHLKWFNNYPSMVKKLRELKHIKFWGEVTEYQDSLQIVNPKLEDETQTQDEGDFLITYPTVNTITPSNYKKVIERIPFSMWENLDEYLPIDFIKQRNYLPLDKAFKKIHGKGLNTQEWKEINYDKAKERLIYEELLQEQIKIHLRKQKSKKSISKSLKISEQDLENFQSYFPYELTIDQKNSLKDIVEDLESDHPMMRLIQGDVGCGKTTIAIIASLMALKNNTQVAVMCPTEALALQHFYNFKEIVNKFSEDINIRLLLGSTKAKEKKEIKESLEDSKVQIIIGTHSLIQDDVKFHNLSLAIIDEQHKFGVDQRLKLTNKSLGCHCLIMTATPIPRSLSLTQYGDLDISIIKSMPGGRKGTKTRIVGNDTFEKFLSFLKTRLTMREQAYIVVPAIKENPEMDMLNLERVLEKFKKLFQEFNVSGLHGQLSNDEKTNVLESFNLHEIDILISTSVVEVGINVPNATVMAIMSPERFGLSSLHQLRGRIGRGSKPGFCFLISNKKLSQEAYNRLKVIESSTDGFVIAEEDLKIRGEGNLFGKEQSGAGAQRRIANIIDNIDVIEITKKDLNFFLEQNNEYINNLISKFSKDDIIFTTV